MRHATFRPMFRPFFRPNVAAQVATGVAIGSVAAAAVNQPHQQTVHVQQNPTTAVVAARKLEKRPVTCCMRISAITWPLLLAVGIMLCCLMCLFPYDLDISGMPGHLNNMKLQEYISTFQFPYEIAFDYQKFGLSSRDFYPSMPNYKFYSC